MVTEETGKLTLIGYWFGSSARDWPDVRDSVDASWDESQRQTVIAHLRKGTRFRYELGLSNCRFCCFFNGSSEQTDGTYYWPEGLAHYLEKHAVRLPQRFVEHVLRGREVRPQVRRRDYKDAPSYETWWKGQTWQKGGGSSIKDDDAMMFLEILRQKYAAAKYLGYADDIEAGGVADRVGRSGELLLQAVKEAQREHEARYGPQAPPPYRGEVEVIAIDMTTRRRTRSGPAAG